MQGEAAYARPKSSRARSGRSLGGGVQSAEWDGQSVLQRSPSIDMPGPGETGENEIYPSMVHCALFVQDWLSAESQRRRSEVLTWV